MTRLLEGTPVPDFTGTAASGKQLTAAGLRGRPTLLQFHRFATCPACFVSVGQFTRRVGELRDAGLDVVAFFYSTPGNPKRRHSRTWPPTSSWSVTLTG